MPCKPCVLSQCSIVRSASHVNVYDSDCPDLDWVGIRLGEDWDLVEEVWVEEDWVEEDWARGPIKEDC